MSYIEEEMAQGAQGIDQAQIENERPTRKIAYTDKGITYQIDQRTKWVRRLISQWHSDADKLNVQLSDTSDSSAITGARDQVMKVMSDLRQEYNLLKFLLGEDNDNAPIHAKYEHIECEHCKLMSNVTEVLREIKSEIASSSKARSRITSRTHLSSRSSTKSHHSDKLKLTAKKEELRIKLKYLDVESKAKLEYDRIQALKNLDITEATLEQVEAHERDQNDEMISKLDLPTTSKDDLVTKYVSSLQVENHHDQKIQGKDDQSQTHFVDIKPATIIPKDTIPQIPMVNSASQTIQVNSKPTVIDVKPKLSHTQFSSNNLNPLAGSFTPVTTSANLSTNTTSANNATMPSNSVSNQNTVESGLSAIAQTLVDQVNLGRLPPPEPPVFSGDPLLYSGWKAAFTTLIEHRRIPKAEQIHYLKKYLSGPARESVENFFLLSTDSAYDEAKTLLDERFGDSFVIANAFRDKLERWPRIASRDSKALLKFSDFLKQCHAAMTSIGSLGILDDDRENRKIMSKLPDWLIARWSRIVHQYKEDEKQFPPFKRFVEFVSKEAKIASDPVTSLQSLKPDEFRSDRKSAITKSHSVSKLESRSFAVETKEHQKPPIKCPLCSRNHELDNCKTFLEKSISDRKEYVRRQSLCFGCLKSSHIAKNCRRKKRCKICEKLHPTCFHGDVQKKEVQPNKQTDETKKLNSTKTSNNGEESKPSDKTVSSFLSNSSAQNKNSMVLPVYISHCENPDVEV